MAECWSPGSRKPALRDRRNPTRRCHLTNVREHFPAPCGGTARLLDGETASCSLGAVLGLDAVDEQALYDALDWLFGRMPPTTTALRNLGARLSVWL
jgi:hypothetical protein